MQKILKGSVSYLKESGGLRPFEYLLYNFNYKCDYACERCCNYDRKEQFEELPKKELQTIVEEASFLGARVFASMGLGETIGADNSSFLTKTAHGAGLIPYYFTNASWLDREMADFLAENNASLIVHMDSLDKGSYHKICRGESNLERVLKNMEYVRKLFKTDETVNGCPVTRIAVNMVATTENLDEAVKIYEFCGDDFVFVVNSLLDRKDQSYVSEERIKELAIKTIPLGTSSEGICEYLRKGITIQGNNIMVCPYSDVIIGKLNKDGLKPFIGKSWDIASDFYKDSGKARCIVRHLQYERFVELSR